MSLCCAGGGDVVEVTAVERSADTRLRKEINSMLEEDAQITKLLLLGAGESGKSTIFKQMKVINKNGYNKRELQEFVGIVHSNVVMSMRSLLGAFEALGVEMPGDVAALAADFERAAEGERLNPAAGQTVASLWAHPATRELYRRRSEFQLDSADSADFFFDSIERVAADDYLPTTDDVLRARVRTSGIVQTDFVINNLNISMFDVGGQRNERRKWIHCFDKVDAVVFVASLSEFDQKLYEDESMVRARARAAVGPVPATRRPGRRRMCRPPHALTPAHKRRRAARRTASTRRSTSSPRSSTPSGSGRRRSSSSSTRRTSLSRSSRRRRAAARPGHPDPDAPARRASRASLPDSTDHTPPAPPPSQRERRRAQTFADYVNKTQGRPPYTGPNEVGPCSDYCKELFVSRCKDKDKAIYPHVTTAIDTSNVRFVFNAVANIIMETNLSRMGMLPT